MERFISVPGIPATQVTLCALSGAQAQLLTALEAQGIGVIPVAPLAALPPPTAAHGDLQLCPLGHNIVVVEKAAQSLCAILEQSGFQVLRNSRPVGKGYPEDVRLNALLLKQRCYGNLEALSPELLCDLWLRDWTLVSSRQGYARCSVCVVSASAAITADPVLCRLLREDGVDCLLLEPGDILLPGYDTGFLGGCCGLVAPDRMAFTGSLERYAQGQQVKEFLGKHGVRALCLTSAKLLDIGGILPLKETDV